MLNNIQSVIKEQVVEPVLKQRLHPLKGMVVQYDNVQNVAIVDVDNPNGPGVKRLSFVPVQLAGGSHTAGPFKGDEVWVNFLNGNAGSPRIVSMADSDYMHNTREKRMRHKRKGAMIPDSSMRL